MAFTYLTNIPLEQARADYLARLIELGLSAKAETIATVEANHRVTAKAVYARISAPHYNACAMDGIALDASKTFGANEVNPVILEEADFTWVNTGDPLPSGCDSVVMVEDVIREGDSVKLFAAATPWQHVRQIGEDVAAGDMIIPSYEELTPPALGALLAAGVLEVEVIQKPLWLSFQPEMRLFPQKSIPSLVKLSSSIQQFSAAWLRIGDVEARYIRSCRTIKSRLKRQ